MPLRTAIRRPLTRRAFHTGAAAAAAGVVTAMLGCRGEQTSATGDGERTAVTYVTGFGTAPHDAYIWAARDRGYLDEAGIDITIELGGGPANTQGLLAGTTHFTKLDLTNILINMGQQTLPRGELRALALFEQQNLAGIVAPAGAGIRSPQDLEGLRVGALSGSPTQQLLPAFADQAGFDLDRVEVVDSDSSGLFGLLAGGQVDALSTFVIQRGVIESIIDGPTTVIPFSDYLPDLFGTTLACSTALAEDDPELCVRFRDAALRGLQATLDDPRRTMELLAADHPAVDVDVGVGQIELMVPLVTGAGADAIGAIDTDRVARGITLLERYGLSGAGLVPGDLTDPSVTLLA